MCVFWRWTAGDAAKSPHGRRAAHANFIAKVVSEVEPASVLHERGSEPQRWRSRETDVGSGAAPPPAATHTLAGFEHVWPAWMLGSHRICAGYGEAW